MKTLYTAQVDVTGGREGKAKSSDNRLELTLTPPKELGGPATGGTNPEQLFAAGYSACFESAVRHVARVKKIKVAQSSVHGLVNLHPTETGGFKLSVALTVRLPDLDRAVAQDLVDTADQVCPYSNAVRGNIDVKITLA